MKSKAAAIPSYRLFHAMSRTKEAPVTPLTYLAELLANSWKHPGELAVAALCAAGTGVFALWVQSLQRVQTFRGPARLLFVLLPLVAFLLFETTIAAWRLYRRQRSALATTRSLLDLNKGDLSDLERRLYARSVRREARMEADHTARMERFSRELTKGSNS